MTAEIAIMNREAIALAADSAVTIAGATEQKVFASANKLFCLSEYGPVGAMVYGPALFMGVPWETIVKIYRSNLGKQRFDTLDEYAAGFVKFLNGPNALFPDSVQSEYLKASVAEYFEGIRDHITTEANSVIAQKGQVGDDEVLQIVSQVIGNAYDTWEKAQRLPSIPDSHAQEVGGKYGQAVDALIDNVFQELPLTTQARGQLRAIAASLFSKDLFPVNVGGVVIAGFGEEEPFPSVKSFKIEGLVNDRLKYREDRSARITHRDRAWIIPFAQSEMVAMFMEGVDPNYRKIVEGWLTQILTGYPDLVQEAIAGMSLAAKKKLKTISDKILEHYLERMAAYRRDNYVNPVIEVVSALPKEELALMAETFVSLTSFKLRVSPKAETVGGPIDVAVISKGDGFVWIKRKHYFKPELNIRFLAKCFREGENGGG